MTTRTMRRRFPSAARAELDERRSRPPPPLRTRSVSPSPSPRLTLCRTPRSASSSRASPRAHPCLFLYRGLE